MAAEIGKTDPLGPAWPSRPARPVGQSVDRKQPRDQNQHAPDEESHSRAEDDNDDNPHIDEYA